MIKSPSRVVFIVALRSAIADLKHHISGSIHRSQAVAQNSIKLAYSIRNAQCKLTNCVEGIPRVK